jgi:hypothetical protein
VKGLGTDKAVGLADRFIRVALYILGILFAFSVLLLFALMLSDMLWQIIVRLYGMFPDAPSKRYQTFSQILGSVIAFASVLIALLTFWITGRQNRNASRKQYTVTILLETRLSTEFRETLEKRRAVFPEYSDVTFQAWNDARLAKPASSSPADIETSAVQNRGAQALASLLNYYEFLAIGIENGDLDEAMLKQSLRGIMCNLVDDCRMLIAGMRQKNPKTYEHLSILYDRWRVIGARDINGDANERAIPNT